MTWPYACGYNIKVASFKIRYYCTVCVALEIEKWLNIDSHLIESDYKKGVLFLGLAWSDYLRKVLKKALSTLKISW